MLILLFLYQRSLDYQQIVDRYNLYEVILDRTLEGEFNRWRQQLAVDGWSARATPQFEYTPSRFVEVLREVAAVVPDERGAIEYGDMRFDANQFVLPSALELAFLIDPTANIDAVTVEWKLVIANMAAPAPVVANAPVAAVTQLAVIAAIGIDPTKIIGRRAGNIGSVIAASVVPVIAPEPVSVAAAVNVIVPSVVANVDGEEVKEDETMISSDKGDEAKEMDE